MKRSISKIICVLVLSTSIFSQKPDKNIELFDEFGNISMGSYFKYLDLFAFHVNQSNGKEIGLIQIYGKNNSAKYSYPFRRRAIYYAYLMNSRKQNLEYFRFQNRSQHIFLKNKRQTKLFQTDWSDERPACHERFLNAKEIWRTLKKK